MHQSYGLAQKSKIKQDILMYKKLQLYYTFIVLITKKKNSLCPIVILLVSLYYNYTMLEMLLQTKWHFKLYKDSDLYIKHIYFKVNWNDVIIYLNTCSYDENNLILILKLTNVIISKKCLENEFTM